MDLDNNNDREERSEKTGNEQFNRPKREDQDSTYNRTERSSRYESYERNTDNRGGGYNDNRGGGYNRNNDNRSGGGGGYNRFNDNRGGGYNENRGGGGGGYNRFNDNRGGGYNDNRGGGGGYNRFNDNRGGGFNDNRGGGFNDRNEREDRPRFEPVYSDKVRAGKRRTYFMDVHQTRSNDYYLTITESTKTPDDRFVRHKIFVYKEDFNRFAEAVNTAIDHIKTNLMPDYDYEEFARRYDEREEGFDNSSENIKAEGGSKFPALEDEISTEQGEKLHDDFVDELPSLDDELKSTGLDDGEKW